jgi:hypothetical protein
VPTAAIATPAAFVEHLEGFADSRGISEENLESSPAIPQSFQFGLVDHSLGAGSL